MTLIAAKIFDGVATRDECFTLINRYSPLMQSYEGPPVENPYYRQGFEAGQFFKIQETDYWDFLEVLPPLAMTSAGFAMSEFTTGDLTNAFLHINDCHYCATIAVGASGPDATIEEVARVILAAEQARIVPTSAFLKWAEWTRIIEDCPKPSAAEYMKAADAAAFAIKCPEKPADRGTLIPGQVAFYENGQPWRFCHKEPGYLPGMTLYFSPQGEPVQRRDALDEVIAMIATADGEGV